MSVIRECIACGEGNKMWRRYHMRRNCRGRWLRFCFWFFQDDVGRRNQFWCSAVGALGFHALFGTSLARTICTRNAFPLARCARSRAITSDLVAPAVRTSRLYPCTMATPFSSQIDAFDILLNTETAWPSIFASFVTFPTGFTTELDLFGTTTNMNAFFASGNTARTWP